jgi:hypothetical protein
MTPEPLPGHPAPEDRPPQGVETPPEEPSTGYRPPRIFVLGKAARLLRTNNIGTLRDGVGGWWVWGS